jgi:hypothetical protein
MVLPLVGGVADARPIGPPPGAPIVTEGAPCGPSEAGDVAQADAGTAGVGVFCAKAPGDPTLRWRPLDSSTHRLAGAIDRLYLAYFDRPIDPEGFAHWIDLRVDGVPLETISESFAGSDEFADRALGQDDFHDIGIELFILWAYRVVLDREADTAGYVHWHAVLKDAVLLPYSRMAGRMVALLSQSAEFRARTGTV